MSKRRKSQARKTNRNGRMFARMLGGLLMLFIVLVLLFVAIKFFSAERTNPNITSPATSPPATTENVPANNSQQDAAKYDFYEQLQRRSNEVDAEVAERIRQSEQNLSSSEGDNFRIQVGAFREKDQAERLRARMILRNYPVIIIRSNSLYLVQIGPYELREEALSVERQLQREGQETLLKNYVAR